MTGFTDGARIGDGVAAGAAQLIDALAAVERPEVIEVGTLRADPSFPTHHTEWAPHGRWTKVDREAGTDVDHVADAHRLRDGLRGVRRPPAGWDAYVACSVFEHLERPWVAMEAAAAVVRPGGLVYVQTHQTFPLHGYPSDFWRFSTEALRVLMEDAGLVLLHAGYLYPCRIIPPPEVTRWNTSPDVEAWLNVEALARKPEE